MTVSELVLAVLLVAALAWAAVQLGPIAIERWF
jgi:hypothetical protein